MPMPNPQFAHARDEIAEICKTDSFDRERWLDSVALALQRAVPSDAWLIRGLDPQTLLPANHGVDKGQRRKTGVFKEIPKAICRRWWEIELLESDVNKFSDLARLRIHASALQLATEGEPRRSVRYREIYKKINVRDELRASLPAGSFCWGLITLLRQEGSSNFSSAEVEFVSDVSGHIAAAFRRIALSFLPEVPQFQPITVVLDGANRIEALTDHADQWLEELKTVGQCSGRLAALEAESSAVPVVLTMVADRARAVGSSSQGAFIRVQTNRKRWADVHGAVLRNDDREARRVAVTIHPTPQSEVSRFLLEAYGLTERERDVTSCLARGFSTKDIAEALHVSGYTVRDHVKAIFVKVGARSRGELMARIFHGSSVQNV